MPAEKDEERLIDFVNNAQDDLELVVSNLTEFNPDAEEFVDLIHRAWEEVKPRFDEIAEYILGKRPFRGLDEQLIDRGLTGIQLELKHRLYIQAREQFRVGFAELIEAPVAVKPEKRKKVGGGGLLGRVWKIINRFLQSIGFLPGPDAVSEFKGVLEDLT